MSVEAMAEYMVRGFHEERKFYDQTLTYTLTGMIEQGAEYFRTALGWIEDVTLLKFTEVDHAAQLTGYSTGFNSFSVSNIKEGEILSSDFYVPHAFAAYSGPDKYQATVLHEVLHTLGLGHPGDYNGTAEHYERIFAEDMRDWTATSYFGEHTVGLGVADVMALQLLYGGTVDPYLYAPKESQGLVIEAGYEPVVGTSGDDYIVMTY